MAGIETVLSRALEDICNNYCKYPDIWDSEKEGCELWESETCAHCPLNDIEKYSNDRNDRKED